MWPTVLVANRGEIAVRIMRTLRALGIRAATIYSDADADSRHVREADIALRVGPTTAARSYLDVRRVVDAAISVGAGALHPGYGFLAENADLAEACADAGIVFIGPPPSAIRAMGDKIEAKRSVAAAGVPVVPSVDSRGLTDGELEAAALELGLPVLLKPSAGGGGKGMRLVLDSSTFRADVAAARREARAAFGDDSMLIERFVERPRHIEIQIVSDTVGNVVHLGERECSLQRRYQKIIEEAPSAFLTPDVRAEMGAQAIAVAKACGYVNVGTVEFIAPSGTDSAGEFFFMEMNARLQVEHGVTELVYGVDLVEAQLRIAAGEPLPWRQDKLTPVGHAVEARLYAEDPSRGFLPTGGVVHVLREPTGPGVRVDSGIDAGDTVGSDYDPLLAKLIAFGRDRPEAIRRLDRALAETAVLGVTTNLAHLRAVLADPDVIAGHLDTGLVERRLGAHEVSFAPAALAMAALLELSASPPQSPWDDRSGWRHGEHAQITTLLATTDSEPAEVVARFGADGWHVAIDGAAPVAVRIERHETRVLCHYGKQSTWFDVCAVRDAIWVATQAHTWVVRRASADRRADAEIDASGPVTSPMPGHVLSLLVRVGERVEEGQALAIVEAMKMEHTLIAASAGVVVAVHAAEGQQVAMDQPVLTLEPAPESGGVG